MATGIVEVKGGRAARYHHNYSDYVYHLRRAMEEELQLSEKPTPSSSPTVQAESPNQSEEKRQLRKKTSNQLRKVESVIKDLETEKQELNSWFEAHPTLL